MNKCPEIQQVKVDSRRIMSLIYRVFDKLNRKGVLYPAELDAAVLNPLLQAELAAGIAILKACFTQIMNFTKSAWFTQKKGITKGDLQIFETMLSSDLGTRTASENELILLAQVISQRASEASCLPKRLYSNENTPLASVRPEAIKQGIVGNCYFFAALASVTTTCPKTVVNAITKLPDAFQVVFAGAPDEKYIVQAPTLMEFSLYAQLTKYGFWPSILEKAYGQYLIAHGFNATLIPADATILAEKVYEAIDLITGQMGRWQVLGLTTDAELDRIMTAACREKRVLAATTNPAPRGDKDRTIDGLPAQHAYSILDWNTYTKRLTLRNPWGVAEHGVFRRASQMPDYSRKDNKKKSGLKSPSLRANDNQNNRLCDDEGVFIINLAEMRRNFHAIYFEEWLPQ